MTPAETTVIAALGVADEEAALRVEICDLIRDIVQAEVSRLLTQPGFVTTLGTRIVTENEYSIKRAALRAIKEHFNNPQMIY